jgi:hypothetical protein
MSLTMPLYILIMWILSIIGVTALGIQESLVQNVSENLEKYDFVYVFGYDNLRAKVLKDLRAAMKDDRQDDNFDLESETWTDEEGQIFFGQK